MIDMDWRVIQGNSWHLFHWSGGKKLDQDIWKKRAVVAMLNEYKQLHNLGVSGPQDATIMSFQEKYGALRAVNLNKEKRWGKIKGRTCAYEIRQRTYIPLEEATLPTIALETLFASLLINDLPHPNHRGECSILCIFDTARGSSL